MAILQDMIEGPKFEIDKAVATQLEVDLNKFSTNPGGYNAHWMLKLAIHSPDLYRHVLNGRVDPAESPEAFRFGAAMTFHAIYRQIVHANEIDMRQLEVTVDDVVLYYQNAKEGWREYFARMMSRRGNRFSEHIYSGFQVLPTFEMAESFGRGFIGVFFPFMSKIDARNLSTQLGLMPNIEEDTSTKKADKALLRRTRRMIRGRELAAIYKGIEPLTDEKEIEEYLRRLSVVFPHDIQAVKSAKGVQRFYATLADDDDIEEAFARMVRGNPL